jgi:predicted RNA-binding Zn-ribbon protein involved in translation (DUF1610 family)
LKERDLKNWQKEYFKELEEKQTEMEKYLALEKAVRDKGFLKCPQCGSESFKRFGWRKLRGRKIKQFQCCKCGFVYAVHELAFPLDYSYW